MCSLARLVTVATLLWALFLVAAAVYKIVEFSSLTQFFIHFTNWAWALAALFFLSVLGFSCSAHTHAARQAAAASGAPMAEEPPAVACGCHVHCAAAVVAYCFFPLLALVCFVALAVAIMLFESPAFIIDLFEHIEPGIVIVANDIFHVIPVFAIFFFAFVHRDLVWFAMNRACVRAWAGSGYCGVVAYTLWLLFGSVLFLGVYLFVLWFGFWTTAQAVYGTSLSLGLAFAFLAAVSFVIVGSVLLLLRCYTHLYENDPAMVSYYEARAMLKTDVQLFPTATARDNVNRAIRENLDAAATKAVLAMEPARAMARDVEEEPTPPAVGADGTIAWRWHNEQELRHRPTRESYRWA